MTEKKDPKYRTFNNMQFKHSGGRPRNKKEVEDLAKELRSWGHLARIVESKKWPGSYIVYIRGTSNTPPPKGWTGKHHKKYGGKF